MMQVKIDDNTLANFPDGTDEDDVKQAIFNYLNKPRSAYESAGEALQRGDGGISEYKPTMSEGAARLISDALYESGLISDRYGANRIGENLGMGVEALPVIGDAIGGDDLGRALAGGDATDIGIASIGAIPVAGDLLGAIIPAIMKKRKGADYNYDDILEVLNADKNLDLSTLDLDPNKIDISQAGELQTSKGYEPQETVKAYKLFRTDDEGNIYPLFVNKDKKVERGVWVDAEAGEIAEAGTKRKSAKTASDKKMVKSSLGNLAYRAGWHAGTNPAATHIGGKATKSPLAGGATTKDGKPKAVPQYRPANQVWAEVEMPNDVDWQTEALKRAERTKAGTVNVGSAEIKDVIPYGGFYKYKTNPNMAGQWMISGNQRVGRTIPQDEIMRISEQGGVQDLPLLPDFLDQHPELQMKDLTASAVKELKKYYPDYYQKRFVEGVSPATTVADVLSGNKQLGERESRQFDANAREILYHGSNVEFDEFNRKGDRLTALGLGHYLTPDKSKALQYGDKVMEFEVDTSGLFDWANPSKDQRDQVEKALIDIVPKERIAHFGKQKYEVVKNDKDGLARFRGLQNKTAKSYNDYAKARLLTDDEIEAIDPDLLKSLGQDDEVIAWREVGDLSTANNEQLMTLMNEYAPNLIEELGYKGARFGNEVAIYDPKLAKRIKKGESPRNLFKVTNITEGGLRTADELGGMPVPSIAVARQDKGFDNFGEISLVGERGAFSKDPTFNADVYSPRFPRPTNKIDRMAVDKEIERLKAEVEPDISYRVDSDFSAERLKEDLDRLSYSDANKQAYLKSIGKGVNPEDYKSKPDQYEIPKWFNDLGLTTDKLYTIKDFNNPEFLEKANKFLSDVNPERDLADWWENGELTREGKMIALKSFREVRNKSLDTEPKFDYFSLQKEIDKRISEQSDGFADYINKQKSRISNGKFFEKWNPDTATTSNFDYNLKNAVKLMKGNIRGGEGFNYGDAGLIRSAIAKQLKSIDQIIDRRNQIVTDDEMTIVKEEMNSELDNLYDELYDKWAWGEDVDRSTFVDGLQNAAKGDLSDFKDLTNKQQAMMADFFEKLAEAPTNYFEIKPQRAVDISEFYGAAVPIGTPKKVIQQLESKGLKVEMYKPEKRMDAVKRLDEKSGGKILFSGGGAAILYGATSDDEKPEYTIE